jgi:hypothetical protein
MKTTHLSLMLLLGYLGFACQELPPPAMTSSQRELADTLYLQKVSVLRPQLDSTCDADFDRMVALAIDSLIRVRKAEEARLRSRILQQ